MEIAVDEGREDGARVCAYRGCRAVLPVVTGRGNRARFCQDGKTWGRRNLTCREAEAALVDADSLREDTTALEAAAVDAVAVQVDAALGPVQALSGMLTELRGQLDTTVSAAFGERDAALAEADAERHQRGLAEARAADAQARADQAERDAASAAAAQAEAERDRDSHQRARLDAEAQRHRAEGRAAALAEDLARAGQRADAAVNRAAELDTALATATAELNGAQTTLDAERARLHDLAQRAGSAEARVSELAAELDALRARHDTELQQARAETAQVREHLSERLAAAQARHEETSTALHVTIADLNRDLGGAEHRRQQAEAQVRTTRVQAAELAAAVGQHLADLPDPAPDDVYDLVGALTAIGDTVTP